MRNKEKSKIPGQKLNSILNVGLQAGAEKGDERGLAEDVTRYGEQIPSQFNWVSPEAQKERAGELEEEIID